jgi:hypothetical protein
MAFIEKRHGAQGIAAKTLANHGVLFIFSL